MRFILIALTLSVCCFHNANAQTTEDSVKAAVNKLFVAMKNSDGEMVKNCFADSAVLQTIARNKEE